MFILKREFVGKIRKSRGQRIKNPKVKRVLRFGLASTVYPHTGLSECLDVSLPSFLLSSQPCSAD